MMSTLKGTVYNQVMAMNVVFTVSSAKVTINGKEIAHVTTGVDFTMNMYSCTCRGNQWPELYDTEAGSARQGLFRLLHLLLHRRQR